jgi:hypothetical protein
MKIVLIRKKTGALVIVVSILNMRPAATRCEMSVMAYSTSVGTSLNAGGNLRIGVMWHCCHVVMIMIV